MSRASIGTPCPAPIFSSSQLPLPVAGRRTSTASCVSAQDDTVEIEYTRALPIDFKSAKPRRKSTFQRRERKEPAVTIFEDVLEDEELVVQEPRRIGGSTLLGKPAQRIPSNSARVQLVTQGEQTIVPAASHGPRRSSVAPGDATSRDEMDQTCNLRIPVNTSLDGDKVKGGLKKEPRRRTIFMPTEDTTMLTIHPGANTTERLNDTFQLPGLYPQNPPAEKLSLNSPTTRNQQPKRPRTSLAAAPKRVPLQQVTGQDGNTIAFDITGRNGGKENLPPGLDTLGMEENKGLRPNVKAARHSLATSKLFEPTAASQARQSVVVRNAVPITSRQPVISNTTRHPRPSLRPSPPREEQDDASRRMSVHAAYREMDRAAAAQRNGISERRTELKSARLQQYPVLAEDLAQPELYEDSWLSHQEVALTELVNQIFASAEPRQKEWQHPKTSLRKQMIESYHQPHVTTLHRRLQASLLYGALSRPKDASAPPNPALDIGLRKKFLGMWLESYESEALRAATQVVFGRQLPKTPTTKAASENGTIDPHRNRRALIGFLETFLVQVDDAEEPEEERGDDPNVRWRKTVLRSFMLIWLLDRAKQTKLVQGCLFKASSPRKSSVAMLHALTAMFIPSIGEVTRILRHLDYAVQHIQDPLDEVKYRIRNIAVDLRDGLLLTRLVELLLFTPDRMRAAEERGDATVTIRMPDLTILESALYGGKEDKCPRILSQHLKMPCLGRSQKCFNVQIAISALHDHGRLEDGAGAVTADDIVDGHREKTLSLLWSLVSEYGLEQLLDFKELIADIKRSGAGSVDLSTLPTGIDRLSQTQQESLLKKWAGVYAARQGIRIGNLTTSFADGMAYAAILDAFRDYIQSKPRSHDTRSPQLRNTALEAQLHDFGCSNAFIKQLSCSTGTIPSRKTTISNLAFLASRLLPLSRQHNAAVTIQRAFRHRRLRFLVFNRVALMRLAHACATVVQTQNRLVSAAVVLQRAWRGVVDRRNERLNLEVRAFQTMARAWMMRRKMARSVLGTSVGPYALRVMGGW